MTENPRVVAGFIDIYGAGSIEFGIDGFRIDTARHVNPEFWQAFVPAMLARARREAFRTFTSSARLRRRRWTSRCSRAPRASIACRACSTSLFAPLLIDTLAGTQAPISWSRLFDGDALYEGGEAAALRLPTFVSNHDNGRFAHFVRKAFPQATDDEILKRTMLAHAMMFTLRGVPVVYSGDEQGFAGDGDDPDAREDMFPSQVAATTTIACSARMRRRRRAISIAIIRYSERSRSLPRCAVSMRHCGAARQIVRNYSEKPGLFAVSRIDPQTGAEIVIAFNTSTCASRGEYRNRCATRLQRFRRSPTAAHVRRAELAAPGSYRLSRSRRLSYVVSAQGSTAERERGRDLPTANLSLHRFTTCCQTAALVLADLEHVFRISRYSVRLRAPECERQPNLPDARRRASMRFPFCGSPRR